MAPKSELAKAARWIYDNLGGNEAVGVAAILSITAFVGVIYLFVQVFLAILREINVIKKVSGTSKKVPPPPPKEPSRKKPVRTTTDSDTEAPPTKPRQQAPVEEEVKIILSRPESTVEPSHILKGFRQHIMCLVGGGKNSFLVSSHDRIVRLYTTSNKQITIPIDRRTVSNAGFSDDGSYFALYFSEDNKIGLYKTSNPTVAISEFKSACPTDVQHLHVLPNGVGVVSVSRPNHLAVHSSNGTVIFSAPQKIGRATSWSFRGHFIALGGSEVDDVRILEVVEKAGTLLEVKKATYFIFPRSVYTSFLSDSTILAVNNQGLITTWSISNLYKLGGNTAKLPGEVVETDLGKFITAAATSSDGTKLALGAGPHVALYSVDPKKGKITFDRDYHYVVSEGVDVSAIVLDTTESEDGSCEVIVVGSGDKIVKVF
eukprot:PhF_6_TR26330/c0_g1_i2/m.37863